MKMMTLFVIIIIGGWFGFEAAKFSLNYSVKSLKTLSFSLFFSLMWNMPYISTFGVNYYPVFLGGVLYQNVDQGWSEYYGSQNIYNSVMKMSLYLQVLYNNNLKVFMLLTVLWLVFMFLYL